MLAGETTGEARSFSADVAADFCCWATALTVIANVLNLIPS